MTDIAVFADPPRPGLVLSTLAESSPLSEEEAADLYAATLKDTMRAAERSGGELLVNYRDEESLPDEYAGTTGQSAEAEVRALAADALEEPDETRFEVQVGSTFAARAGNTVTHLLEQEDAQSVAVVPGTAPMLTRKEIDSAAMKLRRNEVVLGPSGRGRVHYAGFTESIDFEDAYATPEVETLTNRAGDAGHEVGFLPAATRIETGADLLSLVPELNARAAAGRIVPEHTATLLREFGLRVEDGEDGPTLTRA
ncbi:TIGR04282 family arsenosugar biosynthesis glycosyltransferase [Halorussus caseinilyticus]|uniref:TIGR04282 family arsenosugar biosynthesis glycosyltransferase n=1 Tax=Halorussus caseinilyticus TaxID=3034025 RepID=UPI0023E836B6|nr:DUF2064 domain-containing protein [Halorussus sp. DT72]